MWRKIKNRLNKVYLAKIRNFLSYQEGDEFSTKIYSQEGEDILVKRIFEHQPTGFYVDIGAHHPFRFSNTKLLYDMGWRGINIEPNPEVENLFQRFRPEDVFIPLGVGTSSSNLSYYRYPHPAMNTFDEKLVKSRKTEPISVSTIKVDTLASILKLNLDSNQEITLLSIDAEGFDLDVLKSNDWNTYQPKWILVEIFNLDLINLGSNNMYIFLNEKGYELISKLFNSCLFQLVKSETKT